MDVGEMQRKLSLRAEQEPEHRFENLYSLLYNRSWLLAAYNHVKSNKGSRTAGIDGVTIKRLEENFEEYFESLREELKAGKFEPLPVRRAYIPKENGKWRPLGIPVFKDRVVQEALRMILEPIWEAEFCQRSYGFRPNRCTMDAVAYIVSLLTGYKGQIFQWVIEGDIASYFDSIPHRKLMKCVKKRVEDGKIHDLLWKFLRAGVLERGKYRNTLTGTPQGGIVSPLLANIYLHELDRYMEEKYLSLTERERYKRRRMGLPNYIYVRYADDFVVLSNGTKVQAEEMRKELHDFLEEKLQLTLSMEKTKITHITEGFKFLGFWIERSVGQSGKMVPKIRIPNEAITRFQIKMRIALKPSTCQDSTIAKISALNRIIRGWCQYYQYTSSPSYAFNKIGYDVFWEMAHWLGRKYKANMPDILRRFHKNGVFAKGSVCLLKPNEFKPKRYKLRKIENPYTTDPIQIWREKLFEPDEVGLGKETRPGQADIRELALEAYGLTCKICGIQLHEWEAQVDHIKPRSKFSRPKDADVLENLQILCTTCHRAKTKSDQQVLSRMR